MGLRQDCIDVLKNHDVIKEIVDMAKAELFNSIREGHNKAEILVLNEYIGAACSVIQSMGIECYAPSPFSSGLAVTPDPDFDPDYSKLTVII